MVAELWWRNPIGYTHLLRGRSLLNVIWNEEMLTRKGLDAGAIARSVYSAGQEWRSIVMPSDGDAWELRSCNSTRDNAWCSTIPVWSYREPEGDLEDAIAKARDNADPRLIVRDVPPFKKLYYPFFEWIRDLQEMNPDVIFHVHGLFSFNSVFGVEWNAVDFDPVPGAAKGNFYLPCGREINVAMTRNNRDVRDDPIWEKWANLVGHSANNKKNFNERLTCTIDSALWANQHYLERYKIDFRIARNRKRKDFEDHPAITGQQTFRAPRKTAMLGDKWVCDECSLASSCHLYREGAVCTLPGVDAEKLANHFKTRDSNVIINGLSELMGVQADRLKDGLRAEAAEGEIDPRTSKIWKDMFEAGVKLAKLVDPRLNGNVAGAAGGGGNIINIGSIEFTSVSASERAAKAMEALEANGIPRHLITNEMIEAVLAGKAVPVAPAIEAHLAKAD